MSGVKISELMATSPAAVLTGAEGLEMTQSGGSVGALVSQIRTYIQGGTSAFTQNSVVFAGASGYLSEDPTVFVWDATNNRLSIGNNAPSYNLDITGTFRGTGAGLLGSLGVNGALAGSATLSVNGYGYIGSPDAQDPSYLGGTEISAITKANPGVVTISASHGLTTGDRVTFTMPSGMTQLDGVTATVTVLSSTTYSIGIDTSAYSTYTDYATNHGRAAPAGDNLAEVAGLTIRYDGVGGGGLVLRNRLYTGLMFINIANDVGDLETSIQGNCTGNTSLSGSRSTNICFNYGDLGFWTQLQATPVNVMTILGANATTKEGFVGLGGQTDPDYMLDLIGGDINIEAGQAYRMGGHITLLHSGGYTKLYANADDHIAFQANGSFNVYNSDTHQFNNTAFNATFASIDTNGINLGSGRVLKVNGTQVVGPRDTGWAAMTGSADEGTTYDTSTVTLPQLAGRVMALQAALTTHGLIGT
jgi:hypothetical protein